MKQFAIIGLGTFGIRMLEQLSLVTSDIIVVDRDEETANLYKDLAREVLIMDASNEKVLERTIPQDIDAAVVDLGSSIEDTIMVTNYLKKMNVKEIIVKAESDQLGEVLKIVGATKVVFPDRETAKSLTPLLASANLFQYMQISPSLVLAELKMMEPYVGVSVRDANLRVKSGINIVALRKEHDANFSLLTDAEYVFCSDDVLLISGPPEAVQKLVTEEVSSSGSDLKNFFKFMVSTASRMQRKK